MICMINSLSLSHFFLSSILVMSVREKLERFDCESSLNEGFLKEFFGDVRRNVGQMKSRGRRINVHVVLGTGLLEPVQWRLGIVFGQSSVLKQKSNRGQVFEDRMKSS